MKITQKKSGDFHWVLAYTVLPRGEIGTEEAKALVPSNLFSYDPTNGETAYAEDESNATGSPELNRYDHRMLLSREKVA